MGIILLFVPSIAWYVMRPEHTKKARKNIRAPM